MSVNVLTESRDYGRLLEFARENMLPGIISAAIDSQPGISIFTGRIANAMYPEMGPQGRGRRVGSGDSTNFKIRLGKNDTVGELSGGYGIYDTTPQDNVRHGRINWKLYGGTVNLSGHEVDVNASSEAVVNIVEDEMRDAVESMLDLMGSHLYTNSGNPNRITGLEQIISANDSVYGLSGAASGFGSAWCSRGVSPDGTAPASISFTASPTSFVSAGMANLRTAWNQSSEGLSMQPEFILTTLVNHERYEGSIEVQHRVTNMALADAGIRALQFKEAPVIPDRKCTAGAFYFLNTDKIWMQILAGCDFASTPWLETEKQRVQVMKVYVTCEMACNDRKRVNKLVGITA